MALARQRTPGYDRAMPRENWKPFSEPIVCPPNGEVYWIESEDGYLIIDKPSTDWPETQRFRVQSQQKPSGR